MKVFLTVLGGLAKVSMKTAERLKAGNYSNIYGRQEMVKGQAQKKGLGGLQKGTEGGWSEGMLCGIG